jgi:hypothetical protein
MTIREVPDREDPEREPSKFLGIDFSTPCLKSSLMNGIGSGMIVGVAYNLVNQITFMKCFPKKQSKKAVGVSV